MGSGNNGSFSLLFPELSRRWKTPLKHVSFWTYLLVAILGIGAVGFWVETVRFALAEKSEIDSILTALYTYFPAIAAGAGLQLFMDSKREEMQYMRSFSILSIFIVGIFTVPYSTGIAKSLWAAIWGGVGVVVSIWLWWMANGCNPSFLDIDPEDSLGGDPKSEPAGNTDGFQV